LAGCGTAGKIQLTVMVAHLHDHHGRTERVCAGNPHSDAGYLTGRASRFFGYLVKQEKEISVPYPTNRKKAWPVGARVNSPKDNAADKRDKTSFI
jgi:hypothetical protein